MVDTLGTIGVILLIFIGLPVVILRIVDRFRDRRNQRELAPECQNAQRNQLERRLLNPDWPCVERHLQRAAPAALRELFADRELITRWRLEYVDDHVIGTFQPLDERAMQEASRWLGFAAVPIALTQFDDVIYLRPGAGEGDAVYVTYHDGGETELFAESVAQLRARLRQSNSLI